MATSSQYSRNILAPLKESDVDRRRADYKSEIHFIGEVVCGSLFPSDEELFCEASLEMSSDWVLLNQYSSKYSIQTHCCIGANEDGMHVWGHPFDLHLATNSLAGWPKLLIRVWRLDLYENIDIIGYGSCFLPNQSGATELVCETWRPRGSPLQESQAFYLEAPPRIVGADVLSSSQLSMIHSQSSGRVHIHCETILKNLKSLGIKS